MKPAAEWRSEFNEKGIRISAINDFLKIIEVALDTATIMPVEINIPGDEMPDHNVENTVCQILTKLGYDLTWQNIPTEHPYVQDKPYYIKLTIK